jgi:hypothetical protein
VEYSRQMNLKSGVSKLDWNSMPIYYEKISLLKTKNTSAFIYIYPLKSITMQFSEEELPLVGLLFCLFYHIISTPHFFFKSSKWRTIKMNLWAKAQKTLNNAGENTDVELPLLIFSNNTSIPIIVTR